VNPTLMLSTAAPLDRPVSATCRAVCHLGHCKTGDPYTDTVRVRVPEPAEDEVEHPEPPLPPPQVYDWWVTPLDEATEDEVEAERLQRQWEMESQWEAEHQRRQKVEARQKFIEEQQRRREAERVRREAEAWQRQQCAEAEAAEAKRAEEVQRIQQERVRIAEAYRKQEEQRMEKTRMRRLRIDSFLREHGFTEHTNVPKRTLMTTKYPLHTAAKLGDAELVEMLIEERADPTLCDSRGLTPMQTAERHNIDGSHEAVLQVFRANIGEPVDDPTEGSVGEASNLGPAQRAMEVISGVSLKAGALPAIRLRLPLQVSAVAAMRSRLLPQAKAIAAMRSRLPSQAEWQRSFLGACGRSTSCSQCDDMPLPKVGNFKETCPQEDMSMQPGTPLDTHWNSCSLGSRIGQASPAQYLEMRSGLLGNFGQTSPQAPLSADLPMPRIVACR